MSIPNTCSFCLKLFEDCNFVVTEPERKGHLKQAYICDDCITVAAGIVAESFFKENDKKGLAEFRKKMRNELKSPKIG